MRISENVRAAILFIFSLIGFLSTVVLLSMSMVGEALDSGSHHRQGLYLLYKFLSLIPLLIVILFWVARVLHRRIND
jgi:hypothetical protein